MATSTLAGLPALIRGLTRSGMEFAERDGALLDRFIRARDEAAFAEIVRRHGGMVLALSRRLLDDRHLAEDALQATFLVLARKAGSIKDGRALSGWLHRVARHVALRARSQYPPERRRSLEECEMKALPAKSLACAASNAERRDMRELLDEEIARLPDKYRLPVVLCYLQGRSYTQAAEELGWRPGTVSGRLARARATLRERLQHRGLVLSAGALVALCPARSLAASVIAGTAHVVTTDTATARATALAQGVIETMKHLSVAWIAVGMLAVAGLIAGATAALAWRESDSKEPARAALIQRALDDKNEEPKQREAKPIFSATVKSLGFSRVLLSFGADSQTLHLSETIRVHSWNVKTGKEMPAREKVGWDIGTHARGGLFVGARPQFDGGGLFVFDASTGKSLRKLEGEAPKNYWREQFVLSADGKLFALGSLNFADNKAAARFWDTATGKEQKPLPQDLGVAMSLAIAPDNRVIALGAMDSHDIDLYDLKERKHLRRLEQGRFLHDDDANLKGERTRMVGVTALAFSQDGRRLAAGNNDGGVDVWDLPENDKGAAKRHALGSKSRPLKDFRIRGIGLIAFSKDGKTLFALEGQDGLAHVGEGRQLHSWDIATGKPAPLPFKSKTVHGFAISPDEQYVAIVVPAEKMMTRVEVWRLAK